MAIYHLNAKAISRSQGRSATGAAAYRAGVRIEDARTGLVFDYTRKRGVDGTEILTPDGSSPDRAALWNAVEQSEKRVDAQLAREIEIALPRELTPEQMRLLVRGFVRACFTAAGMVADVAFHHLGGSNPHAHILLTLREWQGGAFGLKRREWNDRALCERWRGAWAEHANAALAHAGHAARIDPRTLAEQAVEAQAAGHQNAAIALDRLPTIHERGNASTIAYNERVRQENAARLGAWTAIEEAVAREAHLMPAATHDPRPGRGERLASSDAAFVADMRQRRDTVASRWRFFDERVRVAADWLDEHAGDEARLLAERDRLALELRDARNRRRDWLEKHLRPPWWLFWHWPSWAQSFAAIQHKVQEAKRNAARAEREASPEALMRWRQERADQQTEHANALRERRRLAPTPSEHVEAEHEQKQRLAALRQAQPTPRLAPRVEMTPPPRPRPGQRR